MSLLGDVVRLLRARDIELALVGAAALAAHGVVRSTLDLDLLATDRRALDSALWTELTDASVEVRQGSASDPLAGVVRCRRLHERDVDVVVGRAAWQTEAIRRARSVPIEDAEVPVVTAADLVLLKLYAGGVQDAWDIEQLLGAGSRAALVAEVSERIGALPREAGTLWADLCRSRGGP